MAKSEIPFFLTLDQAVALLRMAGDVKPTHQWDRLSTRTLNALQSKGLTDVDGQHGLSELGHAALAVARSLRRQGRLP